MSIKDNTSALQEILDSVNSLPSADVTLPTLTNPGATSDLARGKELIDQNGNVVTGDLYEVVEGKVAGASEDAVVRRNSDGSIYILAKVNSIDAIVRVGAYLRTTADGDAFGTATPDQVAKGATFTSAAGLLVEGTMASGGSDPVIQPLTVAENGTYTAPNGVDGYSPITVSVPEPEQATPEISVSTSGLITAKAGDKSSTMQIATQAAKTVTPSTSAQTAVASGRYTTGAVTVAGDPNLIPENIPIGVTLFGVAGTREMDTGGSGGDSDICEVISVNIATEQNDTTVQLLKGNAFLAEHYANEGLLVALISLNNLSNVFHTIGAIYHGNRPTMTYDGSTCYGAFTFTNKSTPVYGEIKTLANGACLTPISNSDTFEQTRLVVNDSGDLSCYIPSDKYLAAGSYMAVLVLASMHI